MADVFMQVAAIQGESTDSTHANWIELFSVASAVSQSVQSNVSGQGSRTTGRCDWQDVTIAKALDKSSPDLLLALCKGTHIPTIVIESCKADNDKTPYVKLELEDVVLSSYSTGGSGADLPTESMSLNFAKITWYYNPVDKDGNPTGWINKHWNLATNTGG